MADAGDAVFAAAQSNARPSGPGGTIRDRAVDLARQAQRANPNADVAQLIDHAYAQAITEANNGTNPRDPGRTAAGQYAGVQAMNPVTTQTQTQPTAGPAQPGGAGFSGMTQFLTAHSLVSGIPNWVFLVGGYLLLKGRA